jgi:DNA-binding transcriptional regulator YdaS (Cro superfamily)
MILFAVVMKKHMETLVKQKTQVLLLGLVEPVLKQFILINFSKLISIGSK